MIQEQVVAVLGSIAGGRLFPNIAPNNTQTPYLVYLRIASAPQNTLADGAPIDNTRMQIDCFDASYAGVLALAASVKAALKASTLVHVLLLEQDQYEFDARLHRVILDFSLWHV